MITAKVHTIFLAFIFPSNNVAYLEQNRNVVYLKAKHRKLHNYEPHPQNPPPPFKHVFDSHHFFYLDLFINEVVKKGKRQHRTHE